MITNGVSRFGGEDSGDTRCGLAHEIFRFFAKTPVFVSKIDGFIWKFTEKQLHSTPTKTVWFVQISCVKIKIYKQNEKNVFFIFFVYFMTNQKKLVCFWKSLYFLKKFKLEKKRKYLVVLMSRKWLSVRKCTICLFENTIFLMKILQNHCYFLKISPAAHLGLDLSVYST